HIGGALSSVEIMTVLYRAWLRHRPAESRWPDRDRFILSKGHSCLTLFCLLTGFGYLPATELQRIGTAEGMLGGHPEYDPAHGIEATTGSLGHGLALGCGLAWAAQRDAAAWRTVVLLGDGECQEGSVWEAALFAAQHRLTNLLAVVDHNKLQAIQPLAEVAGLAPLAEKWRAFGWHAVECDGHDCRALLAALAARAPDRPTVIVAHTVKGKGISYMENAPLWHYRCPNEQEYAQACRELDRP
ncbi:MAG TPA: transketolase, partial [bacterium]|nr:transketolase [bacterium]